MRPDSAFFSFKPSKKANGPDIDPGVSPFRQKGAVQRLDRLLESRHVNKTICSILKLQSGAQKETKDRETYD